MAKFHFKYGAMNSGKSDTLIKTAYNYTERGLNVVITKPAIDTKGGSYIVTRAGTKRAIDIVATPQTNLRSAINDHIKNNGLGRLHCILIDEAQFLNSSQVDQLYELAKFDDISVVAFGLRADFKTELFPGSKRLFELVDSIEKLPTMCSCGSQAEFNCRMDNGEYIFDGDQVAIDGEGSTTYNSLCGICYRKEKDAKVTKTQQSSNPNQRILKKEIEGK